MDALQRANRLFFHPGSTIIPHGNAAVFTALVMARELLLRGRVSACIVGGVDSYLNHADIKRFSSAYRLKSDDIARGFVPGEGASFIAVSLLGSSPALGVITGIGLGREGEQTTVLGDGQPTGKGLEQAIRSAIIDGGVNEADVAFRVSDMNGEYYGTYDSMLASSRAYRTRRTEFPQILPAACLGETGAAAGALTIILAATALQRGYAVGRLGACEASSDKGLRGACLVASG